MEWLAVCQRPVTGGLTRLRKRETEAKQEGSLFHKRVEMSVQMEKHSTRVERRLLQLLCAAWMVLAVCVHERPGVAAGSGAMRHTGAGFEPCTAVRHMTHACLAGYAMTLRLRGGNPTEVLEDEDNELGGEESGRGERERIVLRPILCEKDMPQFGPDGQAAAEEMMSVATDGVPMDRFSLAAESLAACSEFDSEDSDDPLRRIFPTMSTLRQYLDPETMTREEFYFSRDYSVEGYEPMPSSRVILDPRYSFPDTGTLGYVPDDWFVAYRMQLEKAVLCPHA